MSFDPLAWIQHHIPMWFYITVVIHLVVLGGVAYMILLERKVASWVQDRSSNWQSDHRTWAQRGGYGGYYIPPASFSLHFGIGNWFRIRSQPIMIGGYPRFRYGGYSFLMVDPWPGDWAQDWYAADDVYVGFDNGYYLYNRADPGEAIAIAVVL